MTVADIGTIGETIIAVPAWTPYVAVAVSGLAGATYAARRGFDVVGVFGLAFATGLGGLMIRDILLNNLVPNLLTEPGYLIVAFTVSVIGFFFAGLISRFDPVMIILDGLAMGFLCSIGAEAAFQANLAPSSAVFLGAITGFGGLILRDILAGNAPEVVRPGSFIAVPAVLASIVFVITVKANIDPTVALFVAMAVSLSVRAGAYWFGWNTGSAADLSNRAWSFWSKKQPAPESIDDTATFTDLLDKEVSVKARGDDAAK